MKYLNDISKDCVGKVCKSKSSGDFKIVKYNNKRNVEIQFLNTGFKAVVELGSIRKGEVKDRYSPSVFGVGIIGAKYPVSGGGIHTKDYVLWKSILQRCYSDAFKNKCPTYEGCEVSDNFKSYEYFYEWCHKQIGFDVEGFELDKDLLVKGNKVYSENTCVFIPQEINKVLTKSDKIRGKHLIGVHYHKRDKSFVARVCKTKGCQSGWGISTLKLKHLKLTKKPKNLLLKNKLISLNHKLTQELITL